MKVYIAKITNRENVDAILSRKNFTHPGVYNFESEIREGDHIFLVLSGDRSQISWEQGLIGYGKIAKRPYEKGYSTENQRHFKIDIEPLVVLSHPISPKATKLHKYLQDYLYDVPYVGANHFPNQALARTEGNGVFALFALFREYSDGISSYIPKEALELDLTARLGVITKYPELVSSYQDRHPDTTQHTAVLPKPFLILAGPSGTGKSRWVRQQAYQTWNGTGKPRELPNYKLLPVKPNWHDSSELVGYVTRLGLKASESPRFVVTDFVRFLVEAWKHPKMQFWLCLDEMNLAPVEQYFAEYLSVVETRKVVGDSIVTDALVPPSAFLDVDWPDFCKHVALEPSDLVAEKFKREGLSLPPNLIVVGTVNMDETTHSFSRKVLDRAFVWEMPIGDLDEGWDQLGYPEATPPDWKPLLATGGDEARQKLKAERGDLPEGWLETTDTTKAVVAWIKNVNGALEGTPFQVSYRVRDELLLLALARGVATAEALQQTLDDGLYSKILPRIEGDVIRTKKALTGLGNLLLGFAGVSELPEWKQVFPADSGQELDFQKLSMAPSGPKFMFGSESWPADPFAPAFPWRRSLNKIRSMLLKLESQFTSYWD